jgi:hypothetical protein
MKELRGMNIETGISRKQNNTYHTAKKEDQIMKTSLKASRTAFLLKSLRRHFSYSSSPAMFARRGSSAF